MSDIWISFFHRIDLISVLGFVSTNWGQTAQIMYEAKTNDFEIGSKLKMIMKNRYWR